METAFFHILNDILLFIIVLIGYHNRIFHKRGFDVGTFDLLDIGNNSIENMLLEETVRNHLDFL